MRKKVFTIAILTLFPLLAACGEALPASSEGIIDNDPIALEWGQSYEGTLQGEQPFTMSVPDSSILTFEIESTEGIVTYRVLSEGRQLAGDNVSIRQNDTVSIILDNESGGEFELLISGFKAAYKLNVTQTLQNDGGIGGDADAKLENGLVISENGVFKGNLGRYDADDAYLISSPAHSLVTLTFENPETSERVFTPIIFIEEDEIFNPDPTNPGDSITFVSSLGEDTIYGLSITSTGAEYEFSVDIQPVNDGGSGMDAGDSLPSSIPMQLGTPVRGVLSTDDTDCFSVTLDTSGEYEITSTNFPELSEEFRGSIRVFLRNAASRQLEKSQIVQYGETITSLEEISAGDYFVCIVNDSPLAEYEVTLEIFVEK